MTSMSIRTTVALGIALASALTLASGCGGGSAQSDGPGCYTRPFGTGCDWIAGSGEGCTGQTAGACPSAGLLGCCVDSSTYVEGATCLYEAALATAAQANCTGPGKKWQTTAP
jgi:hypothetical protein